MYYKVDLSHDIPDPEQFIVDLHESFFHSARLGLKFRINGKERLSEEKKIALGRMMARKYQQYNHILSSVADKLPDETSQGLAWSVIDYLDELWEEKDTIGENIGRIINPMLELYDELVDHLIQKYGYTPSPQ